MGEGEMKQRRQLYSGDVDAGSEARLQGAKDGLKQQKHGGRYVPSRTALSQSSTQKMLPINGRSTAELTPGNIRNFNKQKEDESKGMSNLLNVKEAPKAYSQARSQGMDQLLKHKSA